MFYFESPIQRNYYKQRISRKKTFGATIDRLQKYFLFALEILDKNNGNSVSTMPATRSLI